jgi:hypothetical protein
MAVLCTRTEQGENLALWPSFHFLYISLHQSRVQIPTNGTFSFFFTDEFHINQLGQQHS